MAKPIPDGYRTVTPSLAFKDCKRAIAFYEKAFGARRTSLFERPDGKGVAHATIQIGDSTIMMGDESMNPQCRSAETSGQSPVSFYLYVKDADALFRQATAAGATARSPVTDMFWGDRMGTIQDPFGYTWMLATHVKDLGEDELARAAREAMAHAG